MNLQLLSNFSFLRVLRICKIQISHAMGMDKDKIRHSKEVYVVEDCPFSTSLRPKHLFELGWLFHRGCALPLGCHQCELTVHCHAGLQYSYSLKRPEDDWKLKSLLLKKKETRQLWWKKYPLILLVWIFYQLSLSHGRLPRTSLTSNRFFTPLLFCLFPISLELIIWKLTL